MVFESENDRDALLADFGVDIILSGGTITGIFDNKWIDELGMDSTEPVITVKTSDVSAYSRGEPCTIGGVSYTFAEIQPDGQGITFISLQRT